MRGDGRDRFAVERKEALGGAFSGGAVPGKALDSRVETDHGRGHAGLDSLFKGCREVVDHAPQSLPSAAVPGDITVSSQRQNKWDALGALILFSLGS